MADLVMVYNGLWQFVRRLAAARQPHAIIRAFA
jgi:hypothetical protein